MAEVFSAEVLEQPAQGEFHHELYDAEYRQDDNFHYLDVRVCDMADAEEYRKTNKITNVFDDPNLAFVGQVYDTFDLLEKPESSIGVLAKFMGVEIQVTTAQADTRQSVHIRLPKADYMNDRLDQLTEITGLELPYRYVAHPGTHIEDDEYAEYIDRNLYPVAAIPSWQMIHDVTAHAISAAATDQRLAKRLSKSYDEATVRLWRRVEMVDTTSGNITVLGLEDEIPDGTRDVMKYFKDAMYMESRRSDPELHKIIGSRILYRFQMARSIRRLQEMADAISRVQNSDTAADESEYPLAA